MSKDEEIRVWTERFRALGASDPEGWARSQVNEGIPQYARFVFLREAWRNVIGDGDIAWIDSQIAAADKNPRRPGSGAGPALKRILALGVDREDLAEVVRVMQWGLLFSLTYQLADWGDVNYPDENLPKAMWGLFEVDSNGVPLHPIDALYESVLETDPSNREMRPRGVTTDG